MTRDPGDAGQVRQWRRRVIVVASVLLLAALVVGIALHRSGADHPAAGLTVGWGGSESQPSCVYDPKVDTVDCQIVIDGRAPRPEEVTVVVTAYADENTSRPVGSSSRSVHVEGTMHTVLVVPVPAEKAPFVDDDGIASCKLVVKYAQPSTSS
jgi:hypothetical protein